MKKVLFVDDELRITDGLKRMLRPMRREWDMSFANSAQEALKLMADDPFDVIVSDMRMPGMDGAALLAEVMKTHPNVVRIVLSGQSSSGDAVRVVGVAHQFLAKPCDADALKATINRAFNLRDVLRNESLQRALSQARTLPSVPTLFVKINEELQSPYASTRSVGEIISKDPGMTAKVLQLVNSSFFGIARSISSPTDAAALLGTETLRSLVVGIGIFAEFKEANVGGLDIQALWKHCMRTGALAQEIALSQRLTKAAAGDAMLAGLLHDVGKLILAHNFPEAYSTVLTAMTEHGVLQSEAERATIGATHAEAGAYLLGLWGLPDAVVEAVAFHHCPETLHGDGFDPLAAVHVANALAHECAQADDFPGESGLDLDYLKRLKVGDRLPVWRESCEKMLTAEAVP